MDFSMLTNDTMNMTCTTNSENERLTKLVEDLRQELHLTKQQRDRNEHLKDDLEMEIEKLESKNRELLSTFDIEKHDIINSFNEKIGKLQMILDEERELNNKQCNDLEEKIKELQTPKASLVDDKSDYAALHEVVNLSKIEIKQLTNDLMKSKETINSLELERAQYCEANNDLKKEVEELKESLKFKSETLQSTLKSLEEVRDEKALLANELSMLKAGPVEDLGKRGNSLFSEVEDKRKKLENNISILDKKYKEAKRALAMKNNELEKTKKETIKFQIMWKEGETNLEMREQRLLNCYKQRIDELTYRIKELELRPESPQIITMTDKDVSDLQWVHIMVEQARAETRSVRKALDEKAMGKLSSEENMYSLTREVSNLKRKAMKDSAIIEELQMKLAAYENAATKAKDDIHKTTGLNGELDVAGKENKETTVSSGKTLRFASDVKENDGTPLKKEIKKKEPQKPQILLDYTNTLSN